MLLKIVFSEASKLVSTRTLLLNHYCCCQGFRRKEMKFKFRKGKGIGAHVMGDDTISGCLDPFVDLLRIRNAMIQVMVCDLILEVAWATASSCPLCSLSRWSWKCQWMQIEVQVGVSQWVLDGKGVLRRVLRRVSKKGLSRRHLEGRNTLFQEYDPLRVRLSKQRHVLPPPTHPPTATHPPPKTTTYQSMILMLNFFKVAGLLTGGSEGAMSIQNC